jgi:hypothetical protein
MGMIFRQLLDTVSSSYTYILAAGPGSEAFSLFSFQQLDTHKIELMVSDHEVGTRFWFQRAEIFAQLRILNGSLANAPLRPRGPVQCSHGTRRLDADGWHRHESRRPQHPCRSKIAAKRIGRDVEFRQHLHRKHAECT